jgi:hypothetical protein
VIKVAELHGTSIYNKMIGEERKDREGEGR